MCLDRERSRKQWDVDQQIPVAFYPTAGIKMEVIGVACKMEQEDSSAAEKQQT